MTKEKTNRNEVVGMFLTYCRKTLVNARTDVLRERKRRRNREVLFCDLRRSELESLADWQDVPERETVFDAAGKPIGVTDKDLADALEKLCPEEQAIILLSYFAGMAGSGGKPTRLPSLASFFAIADGLGITPEELIAAMRKEAEVREKSNGERAENDE